MQTYRGFTRNQITSVLDHTLLRPEATNEDLETCIKTAIEYEVKAMCIRPMDVRRSSESLRDSEVAVCTVVGFPHGVVTTDTKVQETLLAIENGAREIDMVMNLGAFASDDYELVHSDIADVVSAAKSSNLGVTVKVILESCLWDRDQITRASQISEAAGADFVKTSTGFHSSGATAQAVRIMRQTVGERLGVKASGGIKDLETLIDLLEAGASRIGVSGTKAILLEFAEKAN